MQNLRAKEYSITLDTKRGHRVPLINITEGDTNSVIFHIHLTENGRSVIVPDDAVVLLYFAKNDDTKTVQSTLDGSVFVVGGDIVCELKTNSIGVSDTTRVEVKILSKNNGLLITPTKFKFNVLDTIVCNEDIESSNEYPLLIELIQKVEELEYVSQSIFGESEVVKIKAQEQEITPVVTVYSYGFGDGDFGEAHFGGSDLVLETCRITYSSDSIISIQPNNNFKELEIESINAIKENLFTVKYKDSDVRLHIRINTGGGEVLE